MTLTTVSPGVLTVMSAFPDPPFEVAPDTGFDAALMQRICPTLGLQWRLVHYTGSDFNEIFGGLGVSVDAVISGTTITPARQQMAAFCAPYLEFNQGIAVNTLRHPNVHAVNDLHGFTVGIQTGNTSDIVAQDLKAQGIVAGIRYYDYSAIGCALDDLESGTIDAVIKLHPVLTELIKGRPGLAVACEVATHERIAIAVARENAQLRSAIDDAQATALADPWFAATYAIWFGQAHQGST